MTPIVRLARGLLLVGVLALLFAPGQLDESAMHEPRAIAAAALAPTTLDHVVAAPATPRTDDATIIALAVLAVVAALVASPSGHTTARAMAVAHVPLVTDRRPRRRGPPASTV